MNNKRISELNEDFSDDIFKYLLESEDNRNSFFSNPINVLNNLGIEKKEHKEIIRSFNINKSDTVDAQFNEKLVLCSSSGY